MRKPRHRDNTVAGRKAEAARAVARKQRFLLGLAISAATMPPGHRRSSREIAAFCEVSHQAIEQIEYAALAKVRRKLELMGITADAVLPATDPVFHLSSGPSASPDF